MPLLTNPNWEMFAQHVAEGLSASKAYAAVYSSSSIMAARSSASRLLTNDEISARVRELLAQRAQKADKATEKAAEALAIDRQWVLARLKENALRALQAVSATNEAGEPIGSYRYEGSVANRALELLGKEIGMFVDRKEIRTGSILDDVEPGTLDEIRALLDGQTAPRLDS